MSFNDKKIYNKIGEQISRREILDYHQTARTLSELKDKYPAAKRLYNLLGICYEMTDEEEKVENLIIESYKKFPNYLFARTGYVSYWMRKGDYTKFNEVFSNCYNLKSLYPERSKFHISEALSFFIVCGRYFANKGDIKSATNYLNMARELRPGDSQLKLIENEIILAKIRSISSFV
jgi:hypothetical protein